jgi:large subunit ribosomal protein L24
MKMHVKKNDTVVVIAGKDKGKKSKVVAALPAEGRVIVEGVNMITRHVKPRKAGQQGGLIKQEGTISSSNVMLWCSRCERPVRVRHIDAADGSGKTRVCARCEESLD